MNSQAQMVRIAEKMGLNAKQAIALPTAVSVASQKVGMTESRFLTELERIDELQAYLKQACIAATSEQQA